jgi:hypothetical protein
MKFRPQQDEWFQSPADGPPQSQSQLLQDEVWTVAEAANHLKLSRRQVWALTRRRGQLRSNQPLPCVRIHRKCLRFRKSDIQRWFQTLAQNQNRRSQ